MGGYWANFIKNGNPNGVDEAGVALVNFPASDPDVTETMWLGETNGLSYLTPNATRVQVIKDFFSNNVEW